MSIQNQIFSDATPSNYSGNNNHITNNLNPNIKTASKNNLEMKDLSSIRKPGQVRNNNHCLSNFNNTFGGNNINSNNNKTIFLNNLNNQNYTGGDLTNVALISEKNSNFTNNNLKAQKDQNINNISITNNTNNIFIGILNEERDKNILKDKDIIFNLQSKKTVEIKTQEKQQQISDKLKLKEIEDKLNKIYSNRN